MKNTREKQSLESYYSCPFQISAKERLNSRGGLFFCDLKQKDSNEEQSEDTTDQHCDCGISTDEYLKIPIINCSLIQNVVKAFENREYEVIHSFFKKITDYQEWQKFVVYATGIGWSRWETHIGSWLLRECRSNPSSPYRALLPEAETKSIIEDDAP
ncbi:MAG: hypothetical protein ABSE15_00350 [Candidatus Bathyarchaeia archaeon]|jgi:hypothetical protein